jgi:hypothetical protein
VFILKVRDAAVNEAGPLVWFDRRYGGLRALTDRAPPP